MALRSLGDLLRPAITWYTAVLSTCIVLAMSAPETPVSSILIFIFVPAFIMLHRYANMVSRRAMFC
jgi:hypothetical protein